MQEKPTLEDVLAVYNSIEPSRRRWIRNVNEMRNGWKELFEVLEKASGRTGMKAVVFDPNWHVVDAVGATTRGAVNIKRAPADEPIAGTVIIESSPADEEVTRDDIIATAQEIVIADVSAPQAVVVAAAPAPAPKPAAKKKAAKKKRK